MKRPKHLVIPDTQVKPGLSLDHFTWLGRYINEKRPDVIVHLGDHWDFPSLCEYDRQSKAKEFHARSVAADLASGAEALIRLMKEIKYKPRLVFCEGNHDWRLERLFGEEPRLRDAIASPRELLQTSGWQFVPYLKPITIAGVSYCHQFVKSSNGRVASTKWGAPNATTQGKREMRSCTAGHRPGFDFAVIPAGNRSIYSLIAGSFYRHDEEYASPQGNRHWRGIIVKHEVHNGEYSLMTVSLDYLRRKYA